MIETFFFSWIHIAGVVRCVIQSVTVNITIFPVIVIKAFFPSGYIVTKIISSVIKCTAKWRTVFSIVVLMACLFSCYVITFVMILSSRVTKFITVRTKPVSFTSHNTFFITKRISIIHVTVFATVFSIVIFGTRNFNTIPKSWYLSCMIKVYILIIAFYGWFFLELLNQCAAKSVPILNFYADTDITLKIRSQNEKLFIKIVCF